MSDTAPESSFAARFLGSIDSPRSFADAERARCHGAHPGLINIAAHSLLTGTMLLSLHHLVQSVFFRQRYLATDLYFLGWLSAAGALAWLDLSRESLPGGPLLAGTVKVLLVYRLIEILSRELWVVMYREVALTSFSRVLAVAFVNYVTIAGLFGHLYGSGADGYVAAMTISLSFSPADGPANVWVEVLQAAYCFTFIAIILAVFVGRIRLKDES